MFKHLLVLLLVVIVCFCACTEKQPLLENHKIEINVQPENAGEVKIVSSSKNLNELDLNMVEEGTIITLKAVANENYWFVSWSGDLESNNIEISLEVLSDMQVEVNFSAQKGTPVENFGNLSYNEGQLVDENNTPIQLRGMSLFWSQWISKYWNEDVVKWLAEDWEVNVIRAAMGVDENDGYIHYKFREKQKVETIVDAAIHQGIYVIIDWHSHHAENYQDEAIEFFEEMATKYKDYPNVIYEIYNEPLNISWSGVLKPYAEAVISAIRAIDDDNIIIVGTPKWSQNVDVVIGNEIEGGNIAYAFHFYASEPSHYQYLRDKLATAAANKIPLFVTEWGVSEASGNGAFNKQWTNEWIEIMDQYKLSWCNWSVADKSETSAALMPGAKAKGSWTPNELSPSGTFIRELLRSNQGYSNPR